MSHFDPIEIDGLKFDRGMTLFEFDAFREPERTRFPLIGEYVKARCQMNEIPTPQMYWRGKCWPDLYIANQLEAVPKGWVGDDVLFHPSMRDKREWPADVSLSSVSGAWHGTAFHDTFIEPMCRKITGRSTSEMSAKYHRSVWLPLYWPQTLREGESLRTTFHYPQGGYAGCVAGAIGLEAGRIDAGPVQAGADQLDSSQITLTFVLAKPKENFSVLFVVDESPIYRITDMDVCAGIDAEWHRWAVESSEPLMPMKIELMEFLTGARHFDMHSYRIILPLPTIANVKRGWKPRPTINEQIWSAIGPERLSAQSA
jgi:hypothetical protein